MITDFDPLIIGRFGRPHGIKGFVTVHSFAQPWQNIINYDKWHIKTNGEWKLVNCLKVNEQNRFFIALVKDYETRELAETLTNCDIAIDTNLLPKLENEYYWRELEGMQVSHIDGELLGTVKELFATGSNDVLVVIGEKRRLIPWIMGDVITHVDKEKRHITVNWDLEF